MKIKVNFHVGKSHKNLGTQLKIYVEKIKIEKESTVKQKFSENICFI
jgi:hypothetical protein